MAQKVKFTFKEKEGKFFAPIVSKTTKRSVEGGVTISRSVPKAGVKGTTATVRLRLPIAEATTKHELYAISSEAFISSK